MMLDPAKVLTVLSCFLSGFTTISSVSLIWCTTSPNRRWSACSTTMLTSSLGVGSIFIFRSSCSSRLRYTSGSSRPRSRYTGTPWTISIALLVCSASKRTSSRRLTCGIAISGASHHQGRDNGQSQRNLYSNRGAVPGSGLHIDNPADLLYVRLHYIHPHTAP